MLRIAFFGCLVFPLAFAGAVECGYVVAAKGTWKDRAHGNRELGVLQPIYGDSVLIAESPTPRTYLEIRFSDQTTKSFSCREAGVCAAPLKLTAPAEKPSGFLTYVLGLLTREGPPPAQLTSRGGLSVQNGLVEIRGKQVDVTELVSTADPDRYQAGWCPLSGECATPSPAFALDLTKPGRRMVPPPQAGLVRLVIRKPAEEWSAASDAWVLALDGRSFGEAKSRWDAAMRETSEWSGQDPNFQALTRVFLRGLAGASPR